MAETPEKIETKPVETKTEEKPIIPNIITEKESDHIISQFFHLITVYYASNQIEVTTIPKEANYYMNEMLKILKDFHIIE